MNSRFGFSLTMLALLALVLSACGTSPTATPTPKPTVATSPTPPPPPPTPTPAPPPPTPVPPTPLPPTPTPIPAQATTKQQVNVRQGPGVQFAIAGKMPANASAKVLGKNEDGKWLQVAFPDAAHPAWVATAFVAVAGSLDQLPVIAVAPPPTATPGAPAPTRVAAATATRTEVIPPPRGGILFATFNNAAQSYIASTVNVDSRSIDGFKPLGRNGPFDIYSSTSAPPFAWSPDGTRMVYVYNPGARGDLQRGATDTLLVVDKTRDVDHPLSLYSHSCISSPVWTPDGKTIVYIGMDGDGCSAQQIFQVGADGSNRQPFGKFKTRPGESLRGLSMGKWLLFVSNYGGAQEIWRLNADGEESPIQLTYDKRENGSPAWSPDSTKFAYYSRQVDGSYQIMVANAAGTNARKLTNAGNNFSPTWSPDGNWIAFASTRGGRMDVYIMDKNGGNAKALTDKNPTEGMLPSSWR